MSEFVHPAIRPRLLMPTENPRATVRGTIGVAGASLGVLGAIAGQLLLTPPNGKPSQPALSSIAFLTAIGLIIFAMASIERILPLADPMLATPTYSSPPSRLRQTAGVLSFVVGLAALGLALRGVASNQTPSAIPLWIASLLLTAVGVGLASGAPIPWPRTRAGWVEAGTVAGLLLVGFVFRYVYLSTVPLEVHGDEAAVGLAGRSLLATGWKDVFGLGWYSQPQISFAAYALALKYVANDLYGIRVASVVQGTLAIGFLYGVARHLFTRRVALLAASFLACAQMAIHYSRIGNNYVGALLASLLFFYLFLEALRSRRPFLYLVAGFAAGLTLSVYIAARLTPVLAVIYFLHRTLAEPGFFRTHRRGVLIGLLGALIFLAPQGIAYARKPARVLDRTSVIFLLTPDNLAHEYDSYKVQTVSEVLAQQAENTVTAFNLKGETSEQYGQQAPLLDVWSAALFVLGVALAVWRGKQPRFLLITAWLGLTLLFGSILTVDAVFSPHLVASIGILAILPALALDVLWRALAAPFGAVGRAIATVVSVGLILLSAYANAVDYFVIHQKAMAPGFFTVLSRYGAGINDQDQVYLLADANTSLHYDTPHFLVPDLDSVDARNYPLVLPLDRIPARKGIVFVVRDPTDPRLAAIEQAYPHGVAGVQQSSNGFPEFTTYVVSHADLLAARPDAQQLAEPLPAVDYRELQRRE